MQFELTKQGFQIHFPDNTCVQEFQWHVPLTDGTWCFKNGTHRTLESFIEALEQSEKGISYIWDDYSSLYHSIRVTKTNILKLSSGHNWTLNFSLDNIEVKEKLVQFLRDIYEKGKKMNV